MSGPGVGTGPSFDSKGFAIFGNQLYAADTGGENVLQIDPITGNRTIISGPSVGSGPSLSTPVDVEFNKAGTDVRHGEPTAPAPGFCGSTRSRKSSNLFRYRRGYADTLGPVRHWRRWKTLPYATGSSNSLLHVDPVQRRWPYGTIRCYAWYGHDLHRQFRRWSDRRAGARTVVSRATGHRRGVGIHGAASALPRLD